MRSGENDDGITRILKSISLLASVLKATASFTMKVLLVLLNSTKIKEMKAKSNLKYIMVSKKKKNNLNN